MFLKKKKKKVIVSKKKKVMYVHMSAKGDVKKKKVMCMCI